MLPPVNEVIPKTLTNTKMKYVLTWRMIRASELRDRQSLIAWLTSLANRIQYPF